MKHDELQEALAALPLAHRRQLRTDPGGERVHAESILKRWLDSKVALPVDGESSTPISACLHNMARMQDGIDQAHRLTADLLDLASRLERTILEAQDFIETVQDRR